jgi:hypothetical protein
MKALKYLLFAVFALSTIAACSGDNISQQETEETTDSEQGTEETTGSEQETEETTDSEQETDNTVYPVAIAPVLVGKGELSGSEGIAPQNRVITTAKEWNEVKTAMRERANTLKETDIDFSAYQVIAIFDEIRTSGGWSIDITGIVEYSDEIIVSVTNLKT